MSDQASILLCDVLTTKLPAFRALGITFPILADSARNELAPYADSPSL